MSAVEFASMPLQAAAVATFVNAGSLGKHTIYHHMSRKIFPTTPDVFF
jgi:hypothetical protein